MSEIRRINHNDNNYDEIDAMGIQIMGEFDALAQRVRDESVYSTDVRFGQNEEKVEFYEDLYQRILDRKNQRSHEGQDVHDPSHRVVRNKPESIAPRVSPVRYLLNIPDGEDTKEFIKAIQSNYKFNGKVAQDFAKLVQIDTTFRTKTTKELLDSFAWDNLGHDINPDHLLLGDFVVPDHGVHDPDVLGAIHVEV